MNLDTEPAETLDLIKQTAIRAVHDPAARELLPLLICHARRQKIPQGDVCTASGKTRWTVRRIIVAAGLPPWPRAGQPDPLDDLDDHDSP